MEPFPLQITWILIYNVIVVTAQTNVALISQGSQCEASQPNCERAFDDLSAASTPTFRWAFIGEAQGNWIKVTFNQTYTIYTARFMQQGFAEESNFKDLELTFEDGTQQQVTLTIRESGFQWEEFTLDPPVETTFVDVFILTAYTTGRTYNGFSEIEFYDGLSTTNYVREKESTSDLTTIITKTPITTTQTIASTTSQTTTMTTNPTADVTTYSTTATTTYPTTTATTYPTTTYPTTTSSTYPTTTATTYPTTTVTTYPTTTSSTYPPTNYPTTTIFTSTSARIATTNGMEETITGNANITGVVVGATVGSIVILVILGGMLFLFFKFRKTSNELQKMKKNIASPPEQPVYYNVAGPHNTEYEEIKETQDSQYQELQRDVSDHPSSSQYQELQVVSH